MSEVTPTPEKRIKTDKQIAKQIARISKKLGDRAMIAGAVPYNNRSNSNTEPTVKVSYDAGYHEDSGWFKHVEVGHETETRQGPSGVHFQHRENQDPIKDHGSEEVSVSTYDYKKHKYPAGAGRNTVIGAMIDGPNIPKGTRVGGREYKAAGYEDEHGSDVRLTNDQLVSQAAGALNDIRGKINEGNVVREHVRINPNHPDFKRK